MFSLYLGAVPTLKNPCRGKKFFLGREKFFSPHAQISLSAGGWNAGGSRLLNDGNMSIFFSTRLAVCYCCCKKRSASMAALAPEPAATTPWRYTGSATSPAANTPGMLVLAVPGITLIKP